MRSTDERGSNRYFVYNNDRLLPIFFKVIHALKNHASLMESVKQRAMGSLAIVNYSDMEKHVKRVFILFPLSYNQNNFFHKRTFYKRSEYA